MPSTNVWGRLMNGLRGGLSGFSEGYFHASDPRAGNTLYGGSASWDQWGRYEARLLRYDVNWSYWQNDAYRKIHTWAARLKADHGLYRYVRNVYNPAHRIAEFFTCHVFNGSLDGLAGDGEETPSAVPIRSEAAPDSADDKEMRSGIARLWRDSRWQSTKGVWVRNGATMGDAPLLIVPDYSTGKVRLKPIHPSTLKWHVPDSDGRPIASLQEEVRPDPRVSFGSLKNVFGLDPTANIQTVIYTREMERVEEGVRFRTYLDGRPFDWGDGPKGKDEWVSAYPGLPLVLTQHIPIGGSYGMGEFHSTLSKIREADDLVSKLNDQIRKTVECQWFFAGVTGQDLEDASEASRKAKSRNTEADPEGGRQVMLSIHAADPAAKIAPMVAPLQIAEVSEHIQRLLDDVENDHPEIRFNRLNTSGAISGTAIHKARQEAETKVRERRAEYDGSLAFAQRLALCIAGIEGFPGYASADFTALESGRFEHSIGERSVFGVDDLDRREEDQAEANAAKTWTETGVPLEIALAKVGWSEEAVADVVAQKKIDDARNIEMMRAEASLANAQAPAEKTPFGG